MKNNLRKTTAFLLACCIVGGIAYTAPLSDDIALTAKAESSNTLTFTAIGQKNQITIKNTTETPTWYSDNTLVATVDSEGIITAVAEGTANVYAVFSNQVLQFNVIVEVEEQSTTEGTTQTDFNVGSLTLTNEAPAAELSLGGIDTTGAVWTSSDTSVAAVDSNGKVTAVGSGTCVVTATVNGINYHVDITSTYVPQSSVTEVVVGSLTLTQDKYAAQITLTFEDESETVWSSTDNTIATVDSQGIVTAQGTGTCRILAVHNGVTYITEVASTYVASEKVTEVVLGNAELSNETPVIQITLSGVPEGTAVTWVSSDESIATVDSSGVVTAVNKGTCTVTAVINGVNYITNVTSTYDPDLEAEIVAGSTEITGIGNTLQLSTANVSGTPTWTSTNINVCTVDENGLVTAVGEGTAEILAVVGGQVLKITVTVKTETAIVYGDANLNGGVDVADAILIMSHVANAETTPLNAQALVNADVYQRGDGISVSDAVAVQKYLTKIISELPESIA